MRNSALPVSVTADLRITADRPDVALTPGQALRFAEQITLAAMVRQVTLLPARRTRRGAWMAGAPQPTTEVT